MAQPQSEGSTTRQSTSRLWLVLIALLWLALLVAAVIYLFNLFSRPTTASFFSEDQARAGAIAYSQHCASCHGANLQGISAPALVGASFLESWAGRSVAELYDYTHNQMPLGRGGTLSDETYAETVAYMLQQNGLPSGEEAIRPNAARLQDLVIKGALATGDTEDTAPAPIPQVSGDVQAQPQPQDAQPMAGGEQTATPEETTLLVNTGEVVYSNQCAACHGGDGGGGIGPALVNNPRLEDAQWTIRRIAIGGLGMPAFAHQLSSTEIAEVTSYIRTNFNNAYGAVAAEAVREIIAGLETNDLQLVTNDLAAAPLGQERYVQLCSACHGLQGGGGVGPPLAGNSNLEDTQLVVPTILYGRGIMPAFSLHSNLEIAEISSYIRTTWGNDYGPVIPEVVETYRPENSQASVTSNVTNSESNNSQNNTASENETTMESGTNQNDLQNQTQTEQSQGRTSTTQDENANQSARENGTEQETSAGQSETTNTEGGNE
jgi:mono/diheme cytochrome c family protein